MEVFGNLESQIDKLKKEVSKVDFMADVSVLYGVTIWY